MWILRKRVSRGATTGAVAALLFCGIVAVGANSAGAQPATASLEAELSMDVSSIGATGPIEAHFTLTNTDAVPLAILRWGTPLEGARSNMFNVATQGTPAAYIGMVVKRGGPSAADYVVLNPGESAQADIDLAASYALDQAGHYTVELPLELADVRRGPAAVSFPGSVAPGSFTAVRIAVPTVSFDLAQARSGTAPAQPPIGTGQPAAAAPPPSFSNCSAGEQSTILAAAAAAQSLSTAARSALQTAANPASAPRYLTWFGTYSTSRYSRIKDHYTSINNFFATVGVPWNCNDPSCGVGTYAYVFPSDASMTVHLCSGFFQAALTGTDSQAGTMIHEISHFTPIAGTDDYAYGQTAAQALALANPEQATMNADSHEYFAENTPALSMGPADVTAPSGAVVAPTAGARVTNPVAVSGTAGDDVAVAAVQLSITNSLGQYWNGTGWQTALVRKAATLASPGALATTWTYMFNPPEPAGAAYTLAGRVTDNAGNVAVIAGRRFHTDTTAPSGAIVAPTAGARTAKPVALSGTAIDNIGVGAVRVSIRNSVGQFWNGTAWQVAAVRSPATLASPGATTTNWTYNFNPPEAAGVGYVLTVLVTDLAGNVSAVVSRTFHTDVSAPVVVVAAPTTGAIVVKPASISGSASDNIGVKSVQVLIKNSAGQFWNGAAWQAVFVRNTATLSNPGSTNTAWSLLFNPPESSGTGYVMNVTAIDTAGNVVTSPARSFSLAAA